MRHVGVFTFPFLTITSLEEGSSVGGHTYCSIHEHINLVRAAFKINNGPFQTFLFALSETEKKVRVAQHFERTEWDVKKKRAVS